MAKKYKISGKRSGPPPLRGPNPNVPPIKMKYGGGADTGAPERAQERADRGYGSVGPVDDRGSSQQNANQRAQVRAGNVRAAEKLINRPSPLDTAIKGAGILKNIATFGVSKVLDLPLGAMRVAKNIVEPVTSKVSNTFNNLSTTTKSTTPTFDRLGGDRGLCPDGSNPPCSVVQASDGKSIKVRGTKAAIRGTGFKGVF
jgi:hypothetical protein